MNKPWYKKWWGILILFILTIILVFIIASVFYIANLVKKIKSGEISPYSIETVKDTQILEKIEGGEKNYWLGSSDPKITIVEFGDYGCPACEESFPIIREISLKYKNDVKIIFRDFPVVTEHSSDLAMSARCAGEQGLFWVMHDKLFLNQGISAKNDIFELAKQIGVDEKKFQNCFNSKKYETAINNDLKDGFDLEIKGTPTWFINGNKIAGNIPRDMFMQIIEELLKKL